MVISVGVAYLFTSKTQYSTSFQIRSYVRGTPCSALPRTHGSTKGKQKEKLEPMSPLYNHTLHTHVQSFRSATSLTLPRISIHLIRSHRVPSPLITGPLSSPLSIQTRTKKPQDPEPKTAHSPVSLHLPSNTASIHSSSTCLVSTP